MEDQLGDVLKRLFPSLVCPESVSWSGKSVQWLISTGAPGSTFDGYRDEVAAMTDLAAAGLSYHARSRCPAVLSHGGSQPDRPHKGALGVPVPTVLANASVTARPMSPR